MNAQGAAATGEAEEPTLPPQPQPPEAQPAPSEPTPARQAVAQSLRDAILGGMDLPAEVLQAVTQGEQPQPGEQPQQKPGEEQPEPAPPAPEPAAAAHVQEDWPQSAKARVSEESEKRRQRTAERDAWIQRAQQLETVVQQLQGQVQQAAAPPTRDDPLRDVYDPQTLAQTVRVNEELEDWCDRNRDGVSNVLVGRDTQGNEVRKDYSAEEIADMKSFAKRVQKRAPERAVFLQTMAGYNAQAQQEYPDLFKDSEDARAAAAILQSFPEIQRLPDFALVIGDVLAGVKQRIQKVQQTSQAPGAKGQPLSASAAAILNAPQVRTAPGVVRRGGPDLGPSPRGGSAEDKQAREEFEKSGYSDEGLERFIGAKLQKFRASGRGQKEPTLA